MIIYIDKKNKELVEVSRKTKAGKLILKDPAKLGLILVFSVATATMTGKKDLKLNKELIGLEKETEIITATQYLAKYNIETTK